MNNIIIKIVAVKTTFTLFLIILNYHYNTYG
jgi:hypothetical protein